jgi:hypothetical protein
MISPSPASQGNLSESGGLEDYERPPLKEKSDDRPPSQRVAVCTGGSDTVLSGALPHRKKF